MRGLWDNNVEKIYFQQFFKKTIGFLQMEKAAIKMLFVKYEDKLKVMK